MLIKIVKKEMPYTGKELRSLFLYHAFDLQGDALASFQGPCDVKLPEMVDQEDVKANAPIYSKLMLHFLGEFFGETLKTVVFRQRFLMAIILDVLREHASGVKWKRCGDDIFVGEKKVSVSIATLTPVSAVIHAGLNILSEGTPVPTFGLKEAGISPEKFAVDVLEQFKKEVDDMELACCKVKGVL